MGPRGLGIPAVAAGILCFVLVGPLGALESATVPRWVLVGILSVETSSYYTGPATAPRIVYVNRKVGASKERGPFQMTPDAFDEIAEPGEDFLRLARDPAFAEALTTRMLLDLHGHLKSWDATVRAYNVGLRGARLGRGKEYLRAVRAAGDPGVHTTP